jgi:hypothetical protein
MAWISAETETRSIGLLISGIGVTQLWKPPSGDALANVISVCSWRRQHGLRYHCSCLRNALASEREGYVDRSDIVGWD